MSQNLAERRAKSADLEKRRNRIGLRVNLEDRGPRRGSLGVPERSAIRHPAGLNRPALHVALEIEQLAVDRVAEGGSSWLGLERAGDQAEKCGASDRETEAHRSSSRANGRLERPRSCRWRKRTTAGPAVI